MLQALVGLVFIFCAVASVVGALARIETWRKRLRWDLDDGSFLRACIVGAVLSGAALLTYVMRD